MAAITEYTDTDAVRSVLGVSSQDVSDTAITNQNLDLQLYVELDDWLPTHATIYSEGTGGSPTAEQTKKWRMLQIYSQYFVAYNLAIGAVGFMLSRISDGKVEGQRFTTEKLSELRESLLQAMGKYRDILTEVVDGSVTTFSLAGRATPTIDPVTTPPNSSLT